MLFEIGSDDLRLGRDGIVGRLGGQSVPCKIHAYLMGIAEISKYMKK